MPKPDAPLAASPAILVEAMPFDERGRAYLQATRERVVIFDGAMGTSLQLANLNADDFGGRSLEGCNEILVVTRPDVVEGVHRSFLEAGVDVVETDAFGAFSVVLADYGIAERTRELNIAAAEIAVAGRGRVLDT